MSDAGPSEIGAVRDTSPISRAFLTADPEAGRLVLVRHGQQHFPPPGTRDFAAYVDPPLSPTGRLQAEALGTFFVDRPVDAVYSSGLQRARDTGAAIASPHGLTPVVVDDLREIEMFRDLPAGMSPTEAYGPAALEAAREAFVATRRWDDYPGTETGDQLRRVSGRRSRPSSPGTRLRWWSWPATAGSSTPTWRWCSDSIARTCSSGPPTRRSTGWPTSGRGGSSRRSTRCTTWSPPDELLTH